METYGSVADLEAAVGVQIGPTDWFPVEQSRIDGFADDTEDHQWIHVDPERAAAGPFGGTVAHGFLTLSLLPHLMHRLRKLENVRMGVNYGLDKVRFPAVVRAGSRIRARAVLLDVQRLDGDSVQVVNRITVEVEGVAKPACVAELVARYHFVEAGEPAATTALLER
jgi:acyl dehydratase